MAQKATVEMSREWLCAQLDQGQTAQQMADVAGVSRTRIYGRLHEEGIRMPAANRPKNWAKGQTGKTHDGVRKSRDTRTGTPLTFADSEARCNAISQTRLGMFGGGVVIDKDGYRQVWDRGSRRYIREHRAVAEKIIGKHLPPSIIVHHMDENTENNDPCNLILLRRREHSAIHAVMSSKPGIDQVAWLISNSMPHVWLGKYVDGKDHINHAAT